MNAQAKQSEPSMEEILASIRRIISDDEAKPAADAAPTAVEPAPVAAERESAVIVPLPVPDADEDILDLSAEAVRVPEPAAPAAIDPPEAFSLTDDVDFAEPEPEVPQVPPPAEPRPEQAFVPPPVQRAVASAHPAERDMASLLSDQAGAAVTQAFGQLAHTVLSGNARTLEDLVKDMLKPMLKTWLDDNLPGMVERLVRAEIERVARGGRR